MAKESDGHGDGVGEMVGGKGVNHVEKWADGEKKRTRTTEALGGLAAGGINSNRSIR